MANSEIVVVTGNKGKVKEIASIIGCALGNQDLEIAEIQALDVEAVAHAKAQTAFNALGKPVVVDDTGMNIEALGGLPGALVSWFLDSLGPEGILRILKNETNRRASVITAIGYADIHGVQVFSGRVDGSLSDEMRGTNGFGYDPIFVPNGHSQTYAEMSSEQKNSISMRRIALEKLADFLKSR